MLIDILFSQTKTFNAKTKSIVYPFNSFKFDIFLNTQNTKC